MLVVGNIVVLKLVFDILWCVVVFGEIIVEYIDFLLGVVNIVIFSSYVLGVLLVKDFWVDMILFIGFIVIGCVVMVDVVVIIKKVFLELGGKLVFVVFDDVDLVVVSVVLVFLVCMYVG